MNRTIKVLSNAESDIVNLLSALASLFAALAVLATFIVIPDVTDQIQTAVTWLVANSYYDFGAYALFIGLAAFAHEHSRTLYHAAHICAVLAWLVFNVVLGIMIAQMLQKGVIVHRLQDIPGSIQLLIVLSLISWVSMYLLWHRHREAFGAQTQTLVNAGQTVITPLTTQGGIQPIPAPANLIQQLSAAARFAPNMTIGPLTAYFDVDQSGQVWLRYDESPALTLSPVPHPPAPATPASAA